MSTIRQEQVQGRLIEEVSDMLRRDLKDPRLGFITITGADVSRDLKYAKVFISVLGGDESKKKSMAALRSATGKIRGEFARKAHLGGGPEVDFKFDQSI